MKVSVSKSKNTTIYYLSKSVRINGKATTKTIEKIGSYDEIKKSVVIWSPLNGPSSMRQNDLPKKRLPSKTSLSNTLPRPELRRMSAAA